MATLTMKKSDMRESMQGNPKEMAAQYRLNISKTKQTSNKTPSIIKRNRNKKASIKKMEFKSARKAPSSDEEDSDDAPMTSQPAEAEVAVPSGSAHAQKPVSAVQAVYVGTTRWKKEEEEEEIESE